MPFDVIQRWPPVSVIRTTFDAAFACDVVCAVKAPTVKAVAAKAAIFVDVVMIGSSCRVALS